MIKSLFHESHSLATGLTQAKYMYEIYNENYQLQVATWNIIVHYKYLLLSL